LLKEIFKENLVKLLVIYIIITTEMFIFSFLPYLVGLAIDDLLNKKYNMLFLYASSLIIAIFFGTFRRLYDTRVFSQIYTNKALATIENLKKSNLNEKRIISRYGLVGVYSDFFEYTLPNITSVVIGLVIAIAMICFIQHNLILLLIPYIALSMSLHMFFSKKSQNIEYKLQHVREDISHALAENQNCADFINNQKTLLIKKSDLESINWSICDSLSIILDLTTVIIVCNNNLTLGQITAVLMYTNRITEKINQSYLFFSQIRILEMTNDLLKKNNKI